MRIRADTALNWLNVFVAWVFLGVGDSKGSGIGIRLGLRYFWEGNRKGKERGKEREPSAANLHSRALLMWLPHWKGGIPSRLYNAAIAIAILIVMDMVVVDGLAARRTSYPCPLLGRGEGATG